MVNGKLVCVHQRRIMLYKKEINAWHQRGSMNGGYSRFGFACESVGSKLYIIGGTRVYSQNHHRYNTPVNTVEICDLGHMKQSPSLWWTLGADMRQGHGVVSASTVAWL